MSEHIETYGNPHGYKELALEYGKSAFFYALFNLRIKLKLCIVSLIICVCTPNEFAVI